MRRIVFTLTGEINERRDPERYREVIEAIARYTLEDKENVELEYTFSELAGGEGDNVHQFRRDVPPAVWSDGRVQHECDDTVHLFASVPGICECGERTWETIEFQDVPGIIIGNGDS